MRLILYTANSFRAEMNNSKQCIWKIGESLRYWPSDSPEIRMSRIDQAFQCFSHWHWKLECPTFIIQPKKKPIYANSALTARNPFWKNLFFSLLFCHYSTPYPLHLLFNRARCIRFITANQNARVHHQPRKNVHFWYREKTDDRIENDLSLLSCIRAILIDDYRFRSNYREQIKKNQFKRDWRRKKCVHFNALNSNIHHEWKMIVTPAIKFITVRWITAIAIVRLAIENELILPRPVLIQLTHAKSAQCIFESSRFSFNLLNSWISRR